MRFLEEENFGWGVAFFFVDDGRIIASA